MPEAAKPICLDIKGLTKRFGGFYALNDLDRGKVSPMFAPTNVGPSPA